MAFTCGVVETWSRGPLAKRSWSWPFGRLEVGEDELVASSASGFGRSMRIRYAEIEEAVVVPSRLGGSVRIRRASGGDVHVTTLNASYARIAELLRSHGVSVRDGSTA